MCFKKYLKEEHDAACLNVTVGPKNYKKPDPLCGSALALERPGAWQLTAESLKESVGETSPKDGLRPLRPLNMNTLILKHNSLTCVTEFKISTCI